MNDRLVVLGPTASGKSDVAMAFAARHAGTELVVVDAMQVYRRMDIGTAKPTAADRAAVVHHCLDLVEPSDEFALAEYVRAAEAALDSIDRAGAQALLVAGTGLYLRALTDPMDMPGRWPEQRTALEARVLAEGPEALHAELSVLDPLAAGRMEPGNARRVVRALEVTLGSGRPFSSFGPGLDHHPTVPFRQIGLRWPRPLLAERIATRVHHMVEAGLVDEVAALMEEHLLAHYGFYGAYLGVRTARKHIGWYVRALPGGEAFRQAMNLLEDCDAQLAAVRDFFRGQHAYGERLRYGLADDRLAA